MSIQFFPRAILLGIVAVVNASPSKAGPILFLSDAADGKIIKDVLKGNGKPGDQSVFAGMLQQPTGLTFDGAGNLFVASQSGNTVTKFASDGTSSVFLNQANKVKGPQGLALDNAGNLFVANNDSRIREYDAKGTLIQEMETDPSPFGLAFDNQGNLFVATLLAPKSGCEKYRPCYMVDKFTFAANGMPVRTRLEIDKAGFGVAIDKAGMVYVSNINNDTVEVLNPALKPGTAGYLKDFVTNGRNGLDHPQGLLFDTEGNLYVANQGLGKGDVVQFSPQGNLLGPVTANTKTPVFLAFARWQKEGDSCSQTDPKEATPWDAWMQVWIKKGEEVEKPKKTNATNWTVLQGDVQVRETPKYPTADKEPFDEEGPYCRTTDEYTNFHLKIEYNVPKEGRVTPKSLPGVVSAKSTDQDFGNSGVYIFNRWEVQIIDPSQFDDGKNPAGGVPKGAVIVEDPRPNSKLNTMIPGALYGVDPVNGKVGNQRFLNQANPAGQWNTLEIWFCAPQPAIGQQPAKPPMLKSELNGQLVYFGKVPGNGTGSKAELDLREKGHIYLQSHWGSHVLFRKPEVDRNVNCPLQGN